MYEPRTLEEIENAMLTDKAGRSSLNGLDSTSAASVWRNLFRSFASAVNNHELAFEGFALEVEDRANNLQPGTPRWYASESLVFQFGDALEYINGVLTYATIDESKQIVRLAAADKENGFLSLKVAALQGDGSARPLNAAELSAFKAYWGDKKFACTPISFISQAADIARITYRIGVDATLIDPATGQSLVDPTIYPVEVAIQAFLQTYQSTRFNSIFRIAELTDIIQAVQGVINPIAEDVQIRANDGSFQDVINDLNEEYLARAGYIVHDTASGNTLRDLLNYYDAE